MEAGAFAENRDVTPVIQSWTRIWLDMMVRTALLLVIAASACGRRCPASWFGAVVCARGGLSDGPASASSLSLLRLRGGKQQPRVQVESGRTGVEEATVEHGRVKTRSRKAAHGSASCVAGNATGILSKKRENKSVGEQEKNRKPELKTIKTDGKRRHRTDPDSGGSSEERVQSKRVSAGKESEERSKGKHKKARDEKKAEKSSKMRTQKSSKMRTREKDGGERTEPQARPDTAVPKTRAAPKPEQSSLDKKPQGMALARKLMTQMGWGGDGHGLGKNSTGIAHPMEAKAKRDTLGIGARHESPAARQRREFKELEEEAFPSFPTRPLAMLNGKGGGAEQCIAGDEDLLGKVKGQTVIINKLKSDNVRGAEAGRLMADEDAEGREEEEGSSTSTVSSSSSLAAPFNGKAGEAKDALTPPRLAQQQSIPVQSSPWGGKNEPFHRVRPDDPEVEAFKRQTGYNYVHKQFKTSKDCTSVGNKGAMRLNPHQGKNFKKQKQKLKDRSTFGTIDVNYRNSNRVVFNYDDE